MTLSKGKIQQTVEALKRLLYIVCVALAAKPVTSLGTCAQLRCGGRKKKKGCFPNRMEQGKRISAQHSEILDTQTFTYIDLCTKHTQMKY